MAGLGQVGALSVQQLKTLNQLSKISSAIAQNSLQLSTLKKINSSKDGPADLIQIQILEQEIAAAEAASTQLSQTDALLSIADSGATEILTQLNNIKTDLLSIAGGTLSASGIAAEQLTIDQAIDTINSLATQTTFSGQKLLDGSASFNTSGVDYSKIDTIEVLDKNTSSDVTVDIEVTTQATQATASYTGGTLGADATLTVTGPKGTTTISLSSGATDADIATAFNNVTYLTGIEATDTGSQVDFNTTDYGTDATISIAATSGTFAISSNTAGTNVVATVNGDSLTGSGTTLNINDSSVSLEVTLDPSTTGTISTITVTGTGLQFITGAEPKTNNFGLPNFNLGTLGGINGLLIEIQSGASKAPSSVSAATTALEIVDDAIAQVTVGQAKIGAFQTYTISSAKNAVDDMITHQQSALSEIQDADIAEVTAELAKNQILEEAALEVLSIISLTQDSVLGLFQTISFKLF